MIGPIFPARRSHISVGVIRIKPQIAWWCQLIFLNAVLPLPLKYQQVVKISWEEGFSVVGGSDEVTCGADNTLQYDLTCIKRGNHSRVYPSRI